jgi:hypothetical protein
MFGIVYKNFDLLWPILVLFFFFWRQVLLLPSLMYILHVSLPSLNKCELLENNLKHEFPGEGQRSKHQEKSNKSVSSIFFIQ